MTNSFHGLRLELPSERKCVVAIEREKPAQDYSYRLRELRETYGMTQLDLAQSLHMSAETISRIEDGKIDSMRIEPLLRYVDGLGATLKVESQAGNIRSTLA